MRLMEIWVGKLVTIIQTGRGYCIVRTPHNFCTQQLRYVGITILFILFWIRCVLKGWTNSFQEVLEAVLFGAWSIPPTAHGWLLCGSPTRVSTTFILSVERYCSNRHVYRTMCKFGILILGRSMKFCPSRVIPCEWMACRNLSPTWKYYLGTAVHAVRA